MRRLTYAIAAAGAVLAADTSTAIVTCNPTDCPPPPPTTIVAIDCSGAALSQGVIWPPNHTMVPLTIVGVTSDSSYMPVTIAINGIYQDEPVNALGSGNTAPDGSGVGTSTAYVRAERAGPGTGRIYFITFTATDSGGNQCTAPMPLQAIVPHDQSQPLAPVDTGLRYDSTVVPP
ncbi:MAG TPA: hypothetical protein VGG67_05110 [Steroidobacteraceae bacterium]|jgi:hypothetical protein